MAQRGPLRLLPQHHRIAICSTQRVMGIGYFLLISGIEVGGAYTGGPSGGVTSIGCRVPSRVEVGCARDHNGGCPS